MDVLPPPERPRLSSSQYPQIPTRTPPATLEKMRALCVSGDIQKFRENFDSLRPQPASDDFNICDFYTVMIEAIRQDNTQFIKELLHRGLPMDKLYALEAINVKAKSALEVFLQNGWDINQPMSELTPPVLG